MGNLGSSTGLTTILYAFQFSYINQPPMTEDRYTDWDNAGSEGAKWFEGYILECDTGAAPKTLTVRNGDNFAAQSFNSDTGENIINHNGQQIKAYSFDVPFVAHLVRLEPDETPWKMWNIRWITQSTPEIARQWITQRTTHDLPGYQHVQRVLLAYNAPQPVTLTVEVDGVSTSYTFPATSGFAKVSQILQAAKGFFFAYSLVSSASFSVADNGIEVYVKAWGSAGAYQNFKLLGTVLGNRATV